ncbi:MAG: hypothetical protein U0P45_16005 [Acidimicrobiales bacterium]
MARWTRIAAGAAVAAALVAGGAAGASSRRPAAPEGPRATRGAGIVAPTQFVSVAPCRLFDSRKATAGPLLDGVQRTIQVTGSAGFEAQGGTSGGCGIPESATAVVVSLTSTQASGNGFLRAWAYGTSEPTATVMNWTPVGKAGITTGATLPVRGKLRAKAYNSSTDLVVDVTGYYTESLSAYVSSNGDLVQWNDGVRSAGRIGTGYYVVQFDRQIYRCSVAVSTEGSALYYSTAVTSNDKAFVSIANLAVSGAPAINAPFNLTVTC